MDHGPGLLEPFISQIWISSGPQGAGGGLWIAELDDGVANLIRGTSLRNRKLAFTCGKGFSQNTEQFIHDRRTRH